MKIKDLLNLIDPDVYVEILKRDAVMHEGFAGSIDFSDIINNNVIEIKIDFDSLVIFIS